MVLGCAGAGKTTFSRRLAERIGAPHICLDEMWDGPLQPRDVPAFRELIAQAHLGDTWVSDGNFAKASFDLRAPRADLIIWLAPPRSLCAWRALRRIFDPDEPHRPRDLWKVLTFIVGFESVNRPLIEGELAQWAPAAKQIRLTTHQDIESLFRNPTHRPRYASTP
jgi:adenylate kinase family enzyme